MSARDVVESCAQHMYKPINALTVERQVQYVSDILNPSLKSSLMSIESPGSKLDTE